MEIEIIDVTHDEVIGRETKEIRASIEKLIDYASKNGFEHEGKHYLEMRWINSKDSRLFEKSGLIKKAGTLHDLRNKGIISFEESYMHDGGVAMYKINNNELNKRISERRNGETAKN